MSHIRFMFRLAEVIIFFFCHHLSSDGWRWAVSAGEKCVCSSNALCVKDCT